MKHALIVENHPWIRAGLLAALKDLFPGWIITAIADNELANVELQDRLDIAILGVTTADDSESTLVMQVVDQLRPLAILVLTDSDDCCASCWRTEAPIRGCLQKRSAPGQLGAALRLIVAGGDCFRRVESSISEAPIRIGVHDIGHALAADPRPSESADETLRRAQSLNITPRQYEVLVLLARGYPIKTVSRMLNISPATAKAHASSLYQRLNVSNKGQAVFAARKLGALPHPC